MTDSHLLGVRAKWSPYDAGLEKRTAWKVVGEFVDHGVSGSTEKCPALDKLMRGATVPYQCRDTHQVMWDTHQSTNR